MVAAALCAQYPVINFNLSGSGRIAAQAPGPLTDLSSYTWVQQLGATLTQTTFTPPVVWMPNAGGFRIKLLQTALPAPPYTVTLAATISQTPADITRQAGIGIILRDSVLDTAVTYFTENEWSQYLGFGTCCRVLAGVYNSAIIGVNPDLNRIVGAPSWASAPGFPAQRWWIRIVDDGVHRTFYYAADDGHAWILDHQDDSGQYVVPDTVGIGGDSLDAALYPGFYATIWQFTVTVP